MFDQTPVQSTLPRRIRTGDRLRLSQGLLLASAAIIVMPQSAQAACAGIATAFCIASFTQAETPAGATSSGAGFAYSGIGAFAVKLNDPLSSFATGVRVDVTDGGEAKVTTGGKIDGADAGINVRSAVGPAVAIVGPGGIFSGRNGVIAVSGGIGNVTVSGTGNIDTQFTAISALSAGGNILIDESGALSARNGITALTTGMGGSTIKTVGPITVSFSGVQATTENGLNTLLVGSGGIKTAAVGTAANVTATGTGDLSIVISGDVAGVTSGLRAFTNTGRSTISIDRTVKVSGTDNALSIASLGGSALVTNNGTIQASAGPAYVSSMGTGAGVLSNNGVIYAPGIALSNTSGGLAVTNNGTIDGAIVSAPGATTGLVNLGTFANAAGSALTTFTNTGTFSLGPANGAPGAATVSGNAIFNTNSIWNVRMSSTGVDQLQVGGTTSINGGTLNIAVAPGRYTFGQSFEILQSEGLVTGTFANTRITGANFTSNFLVTPNGISITLGYGFIAPLATNRNQFSVANAFDKATRVAPTGLAGKYLSALYEQEGNTLDAALNQVNADAPGAAINANLLAGRQFSETIAARQAVMRSAGAVPREDIQAQVSNWYTGASQARPTSVNTGGFSVWSAGFGSIGAFSADNKTGASRQTQNVAGAMLGVDYQSEGTSAGVAGGVSQGTFKAGNVAHGNARGVHGAVYAALTSENLYVSGALTGAQYNDDTSRVVSGSPGFAAETQTGNVRAREVRARLEAGWHDKSEGFHVSPFAALEVAVLQTPGYTESLGNGGGAGMLAMKYASQTTSSVPAFLGVRLDGNIHTSSGILVSPHLSVALVHDFAAKREFDAVLAVVPGASFKLVSARPGATSLQVKGGIEAHLSRHVAIFASLEGDFSGKNHNVTGRGGASVRW